MASLSQRILAACLLAVVASSQACLAVKIDCHPTPGASKEACEALGCVWAPVNQTADESTAKPSPVAELGFDPSSASLIPNGMPGTSNVQEPWCHMPDDYVGYFVAAVSENRITLQRKKPSGLPGDFQDIVVDIKNFGTGYRIFIYPSRHQRFIPDLPTIRLDKVVTTGESIFEHHHEEGRLMIKRKSTGAIVFDTDLTKLIFADKFMQLTSKLNSPLVYGLGEHYDTFLKYANAYKTYSFFHTDKVTLPGGARSYGSFPLYINIEADMRNAHGVYLHNTDPMDIVLQKDQAITFRPIGGVFDFIIYGGPTPNDVIAEYQKSVGLPALPPIWSLGFHLCRYQYGTLAKTKEVYERTRNSGIPFDVQWNDIDNMERHNDFTYDKERFQGLPEFIKHLHDTNMHYMLLFDPGLSLEENYHPYELGERMNIWVKNATNQTLVGKVWNDSGRTVFPDFSNPQSVDFWTQLFVKFQQEIAYDGAWIDMNDISNFVRGSLDGCPADNPLENPPYKPGGYDLQTNTLCLSAKHFAGEEYHVHNLYSFYEAIATYEALKAARPAKRPLVISRSTSPGQGKFGGHWSGDVLSTWDYLRWSIPSLIEHSMYGFSLMGTDICGFGGNTNAELCARWSTLGAFYTFSRNHNDDISIDQDPVAMGEDVVKANKYALTKKYKLLPYLYTLMHRASRYGEPAIRSVPLEFYRDHNESLAVEMQFLWGRGFMISPVVEQGSSSKATFLPPGRWYESNVVPSNNSIKVNKIIDSNGIWYQSSNVALYDIPIFYRGGHIFPMYDNVMQTIPDTVKQPFRLNVALCAKKQATGELFYDDGDNVDGSLNYVVFKAKNKVLNISLINNGHSPKAQFGKIKIMGVSDKVNSVKANGKPVEFEQVEHVLQFNLDGLETTVEKSINVEWS